MQCGELIYREVSAMTKGSRSQSRPEKETIHSGHFMVSHFEAEAQDDEDDLAVPVPEEDEVDIKFGQVPVVGISVNALVGSNKDEQLQQQISIETSLNKLFHCMSLAYRQKLTSPKWNRFKGIKLRWKDKIRLNNVIWRCWHMQFIMKQNTLVCQFASPLDVDTHIKPEATILEGKYWKRRAEAVTAEYKKWRMYYRNRALGWGNKDVPDVISDMDVLDWHSQGDNSHMLVDEDYIAFMSDTLFSTITSNQPFAFPDTREIARGASLADFIQPSLGPLQPNLEDFMDTFEPLQDLLSVKLPPVPEESITPDDHVYRNNFSQALMDPNLQQVLEQTSQYHSPHSSMQAQHVPHLPPHLQAGHTEQIMTQGSLARSIQSISQNTSTLNSQQSAQHANILSSHGGQNATYVPQANQNTNQQINMNISSMAGQPQSMMMQQPYGVHQSSMISAQNVGSGSMMVQQQQNVLSNAQLQMQKNSQQYMQGQKMYPHVPVGSFQERNYNVPQGMHQSRTESTSYVQSPRGCSSRPAYLQDRGGPRPRPGPFTPQPQHGYSQFAGAPQPVADKSSYNEQCMERGLSTQQHGGVKSGGYVNTVENTAANLSLAGARFKMPSPPPQVANSSGHRASSGPQQKQSSLPKGENFRSNSLPLGATLGSVLAGSSGGGSSSRGSSVSRRPRSGSSSPASPQRRGPQPPPPLLAAASEPLLSQSSVLLAHLLNTKGQGLYKPTSAQSLTQESQPHPVAIIQALPSGSSSSQLITVDSHSPTGAGAPSPQSPLPASPGSGGENRRAGHIHSEQKRRYNIKNGFDLLQSLIPQLSANPNAKVSKAAMLQKGAEYIRQLQAERTKMKEEMETLKQQIEVLNNSISNCQSLLPATGAPVSRQRSGRLKEMFDEYVCQRTNENWKFWIFSLLVEPLLTSFNNSVSPASTDELKRSTFLWAEQHCSLVEMRPAVLNSLRSLCTSTDILSDPDKLPEEACAAVNKRKKEPGSSYKK